MINRKRYLGFGVLLLACGITTGGSILIAELALPAWLRALLIVGSVSSCAWDLSGGFNVMAWRGRGRGRQAQA